MKIKPRRRELFFFLLLVI